MVNFLIVVHIVVCILLLLVILMQAGRGGGLTEAFVSAESMFGAQTSGFLIRMTSILAALFIGTSLSLAFLSSNKQKSLMESTPFKEKMKVPLNAVVDKSSQPTLNALTNSAL